MENISTLQERINEKAEKRMWEDFSKFRNLIEGTEFIKKLNRLNIPLRLLSKDDKLLGSDNRVYFLFSDTFYKFIKKRMLEAYIKEETDTFLKGFEDVQQRLTDLEVGLE